MHEGFRTKQFTENEKEVYTGMCLQNIPKFRIFLDTELINNQTAQITETHRTHFF